MKLGLFFSRGGSLREWLDTGLLDREKLLFESHLTDGRITEVFWLTYGVQDGELAEKIHEDGKLHRRIRIIPMPHLFAIIPLGIWFYSLLMPIIHRKYVGMCDVLRTNQMDGSWAAVIASWIAKKPLIIRTGYTISRFELLKKQTSRLRLVFWLIIERLAYINCSLALVSSEHDQSYVMSQHGLTKEKVKVLRNYIDTNLFKPSKEINSFDDDIVYVGRLSTQKNLHTLIRAVADLNLKLDIYGQGELENELRVHATNVGANVRFLGAVNNDQLPHILNQYSIFVLPSLYEGMPKTLLEAMACGLLCVGADVEGVSEVLTSEKTGFLAPDTTLSSFLAVLKMAISNPIRKDICLNARNHVCSNYSLKTIVDDDWNYLKCITTY